MDLTALVANAHDDAQRRHAAGQLSVSGQPVTGSRSAVEFLPVMVMCSMAEVVQCARSEVVKKTPRPG